MRLAWRLVWERWLKQAGPIERGWVLLMSTSSFAMMVYQLAGGH